MDRQEKTLEARYRIVAWLVGDYRSIIEAADNYQLTNQLLRIWKNTVSGDRVSFVKAVISTGRLANLGQSIQADRLKQLARVAENGRMFWYPGSWHEPIGQFVIGTLHEVFEGDASWESMQEYNPLSFRSQIASERAMTQMDQVALVYLHTPCDPNAALKAFGRRMLQTLGITPVVGHGTCPIQL